MTRKNIILPRHVFRLPGFRNSPIANSTLPLMTDESEASVSAQPVPLQLALRAPSGTASASVTLRRDARTRLLSVGAAEEPALDLCAYEASSYQMKRPPLLIRSKNSACRNRHLQLPSRPVRFFRPVRDLGTQAFPRASYRVFKPVVSLSANSCLCHPFSRARASGPAPIGLSAVPLCFPSLCMR